MCERSPRVSGCCLKLLKTEHSHFCSILFVSCLASCRCHPLPKSNWAFPKWECVQHGQYPVVRYECERATPDNILQTLFIWKNGFSCHITEDIWPVINLLLSNWHFLQLQWGLKAEKFNKKTLVVNKWEVLVAVCQHIWAPTQAFMDHNYMLWLYLLLEALA